MKNPALARPPSQKAIQCLAAWHRVQWHLRVNSLRTVRRTLDVAVVLSASALLMPLLVVVAVLIRSYDGGPVLYWQKRGGRRAPASAYPKFRSLCVDADIVCARIAALNRRRVDSVTFTMKHDPRVTPIGRIIRRFSIDELPQLWCVLTGDMTLFGARASNPSDGDIAYIHHRSLWADVNALLKTIPAALLGRSAY